MITVSVSMNIIIQLIDSFIHDLKVVESTISEIVNKYLIFLMT